MCAKKVSVKFVYSGMKLSLSLSLSLYVSFVSLEARAFDHPLKGVFSLLHSNRGVLHHLQATVSLFEH